MFVIGGGKLKSQLVKLIEDVQSNTYIDEIRVRL